MPSQRMHLENPFPIHTPPERENLVGLLNQRYQKLVFCQYQNILVKIIFFGDIIFRPEDSLFLKPTRQGHS
jgi:hypothetical protein